MTFSIEHKYPDYEVSLLINLEVECNSIEVRMDGLSNGIILDEAEFKKLKDFLNIDETYNQAIEDAAKVAKSWHGFTGLAIDILKLKRNVGNEE